jgi:outer membrane protein assembly factor BamB
VLGGVVTRERTCPACDHTVRERSARWCGSCGAPLAAAVTEPPAPATSPWRRRALLAAVIALVGAVAVSAGGGIVDRAGDRPAAVQDVAVTAPDVDALDALEPEAPPREPTLQRPTCARTGDQSCFLWTAETGRGRFDAVAVGDGLLVSEDALGGALVARDVHDGTVVWAADLPRGFSEDTLRVVGDVLVHASGGELVVRELVTGVERWRTGELGRLAPYDVHLSPDVLVAVGESHRATSEGGGPPNAVAAGFDPASGEVLWRREGRNATLAAGGVTVLTTEAGELRAHEPTGERRWQLGQRLDLRPAGRPGADQGASVWASGHVVSIHDGDAHSELHRLADGAPLGFDGFPMVDDDEHTLVELHEGRVKQFALFDELGEVWRTEGPGLVGCASGASLEADTVEISTCGGGRLSLDRSDGTELARTPPPTTRADAYGGRRFGRVGPFELTNGDPTAQAAAVVVTDLRDGSEVARMPSDSHPVWRERVWSDRDLGGVVVIRSRGWLSALALRGDRRPPDRRDPDAAAG